MKVFKRLRFSFLFLIVSCSTSDNTNYIKSKVWSFNGGFKIGEGDFVIFDKSKVFELKEDTIYYKNQPKAIIKDVDKKNFVMKVRSLDGNEVGIYRNVEESLQ